MAADSCSDRCQQFTTTERLRRFANSSPSGDPSCRFAGAVRSLIQLFRRTLPLGSDPSNSSSTRMMLERKRVLLSSIDMNFAKLMYLHRTASPGSSSIELADTCTGGPSRYGTSLPGRGRTAYALPAGRSRPRGRGRHGGGSARSSRDPLRPAQHGTSSRRPSALRAPPRPARITRAVHMYSGNGHAIPSDAAEHLLRESGARRCTAQRHRARTWKRLPTSAPHA